MNTKVFFVTLIAVFLSFAGGFLLANALNKSELDILKAENERLKNIQNEDNESESEFTLAAEEIRKRIEEADLNPANIAFQKNLGIALYRYAIIKRDADLLDDVSRLLERVYKTENRDYETIVTLGNIYSDIGYYKKENEKFAKAREYYREALEQKPNDIDIRTYYGLTYFYETPPETEKALMEFQKSIKDDPKHEKTLQALTEALLSQNKNEEAERYLSKLREVNRDNPAINELSTQLNKNRNNQQQK
jgi:tetratricopeptide (TPR) repeat protein